MNEKILTADQFVGAYFLYQKSGPWSMKGQTTKFGVILKWSTKKLSLGGEEHLGFNLLALFRKVLAD